MVGGREIKIVLSADDKDLSVKVVQAGRTLQQLKQHAEQTAESTKRLEERFLSFGSRLKDATLTISTLRFALRDIQDIFLFLPNAVVKSSAEVERMTALMKGLSKEIGTMRDAEAKANTAFVFNLAKSAPFEVKALGDAFVKLKVGGIDPTNGSLQALVDSVARFGGSGETLKRAAIAIQQMGGKGVISMEELRQQLGEAVPDAMQALATGVGLTMNQLTKEISKGTVLAAGNLDRMFAVLAVQNAGAASEMVKTWTGLTEQLKTKWTLFMNEVGANGFFDQAKNSLRELLDAFNTDSARSLAQGLGQALSQITSALIAGINVVREYGAVFEWIAGIWAAKFTADKLRSLGQGIRESLSSSGLRQVRQEFEDRLMASRRTAAIELQDKITFNNAMIADNERARTAEDRSARAAELLKIRARQRELRDEQEAAAARLANFEKTAAASRASVEAQIVDLQRLSAAREADLRQQNAAAMRAAGNRGGGLNNITQAINNLGIAENEKARAVLQSRIRTEQELAAAIDREATAERNRIASLAAGITAQKEALKATQASALATSANSVAIGALNTNLAGANAQLAKKAQELTKVTTGMRLLSGAMTAASSIFNAFGGWVGLAVAALTYLGTKLYEFSQRWERVEEIRKRIVNGGPTNDKEIQETRDRRDETEREIATLERMLRTKQILAQPSNTNGSQRILAEGEIPEIQARIEAAKKRLNDFNVAITQGGSWVVLDKADQEVSNILRSHQTRMDKLAGDMNASIAKLDQDARTKLKSATPEQREKIETQLGEDKRKLIRSWQEENVRQLTAIRDQANADREKVLAANDKADTDAVKAATLRLNKTQEALNQAKAQLDTDIGKLSTGAGQQKIKHEDPLLRWLNAAQFGLEKAKIQLDALVKDTGSFIDKRNAAAADLLAKIASGEADHKSDDGKTVKYVGGQQERTKYLQEFQEYLRSGRTDLDAFIDSLKGLDAIDKQRLKSATEALAKTKELSEQEKAITDVRQFATQAQSTLTSAIEDYQLALSKTPAMDKAVQHFDMLATKVSKAGIEFQEFQKKRAQALADTATAGAYQFGSDSRKASAQLPQVEATTVQGRIDAERDAKLKALQELTSAHRRNVELYVSDENQKNAALMVLDQGYAAQSKLIEAEHFRASKTEVQKLREAWGDTTQDMNQMTGRWASGFLDAIVNTVVDGKLRFSDLIKSIGRDLLTLQVKKTLGNTITNAVDGLGTAISSAFGLGKTDKTGAANDKQASAAAASAQAMTTLAQNVTGFSSGALASQIAQTVAGTAADLTQTTVTASATSSLALLTGAIVNATAAMYAMASAAASAAASNAASTAMAFFADGGVMTSAGKVPLNFYANGGVADRPQMAIFGEGRRPEAYVPLPDGRSIPVTVSGSMGGGGVGSVVVNVINQTSQPVTATQSAPRFDGKQMVLDVVLSAAGQPGSFRDGMKAALR